MTFRQPSIHPPNNKPVNWSLVVIRGPCPFVNSVNKYVVPSTQDPYSTKYGVSRQGIKRQKICYAKRQGSWGNFLTANRLPIKF